MRAKIKQLVEALGISPGFTFLYGLKAFSNIAIDDYTGVNFCLCMPFEKTKIANNGGVYDTVKMRLFFGSRIEFTDNYEDHLTVIDVIEPYVNEFCGWIQTDEHIKVIGNIVQNEFINDLDDNISGVAIELTILDLTSNSVC